MAAVLKKYFLEYPNRDSSSSECSRLPMPLIFSVKVTKGFLESLERNISDANKSQIEFISETEGKMYFGTEEFSFNITKIDDTVRNILVQGLLNPSWLALNNRKYSALQRCQVKQ